MSGAAAKRRRKRRKGKGLPDRPKIVNHPSLQRRTSSGKIEPENHHWSRVLFTSIFAALAIMSDTTGVAAGPGPVQVGLGLLTVGISFALLFLRKRLAWIVAPKIVSGGLVLAGLAVTALGYHTVVSTERQEKRTDLSETCAAARDLEATFSASVSGLVASDWDSKDQDRYALEIESDLQALSAAADRTDSQEAQTLAHDVRSKMLASFGSKKDISQVATTQRLAWDAFGKLAQLCDRAGIHVSTTPDLATKPDARTACTYFVKLLGYAKKPPPSGSNAVGVAFRSFFYNAMNSGDEDLINDSETFLRFTAGHAEADNGIDSVASDCAAMGITQPASSK